MAELRPQAWNAVTATEGGGPARLSVRQEARWNLSLWYGDRGHRSHGDAEGGARRTRRDSSVSRWRPVACSAVYLLTARDTASNSQALSCLRPALPRAGRATTARAFPGDARPGVDHD